MLRYISIALAATALVSVPLAAQTAKTPSDPVFEAKLRATLLAHPEYILEAVNSMQQRQRDQQLTQQNAKISPVRPVLFAREPFGPVIGNPAGKVTAVELLDYACPFCKRAHTLVDKIASEDKNVRFIIVMRPVLGPESETLARFALAAQMQGRFAQAHDALYAKFGDDHQTHATDDNLREVAQKAGVDFDRAKRDMTSDTVVKQLAKHQQIADQMGVSGTPFFVTATTVIPGAPQSEEQLKAAIKGS